MEVVDLDERWGFTLMVGISMSGELLPFQAIYCGISSASLPSPKAPGYKKATQELNFQFEYSKTNNHWSTIGTMKSYVTGILVSYFKSHQKRLKLLGPTRPLIRNYTSCKGGKGVTDIREHTAN